MSFPDKQRHRNAVPSSAAEGSYISDLFTRKLSEMCSRGRSSGLQRFSNCLPAPTHRNSDKIIVEKRFAVKRMLLTATGIAPDLHRTSLLINTTIACCIKPQEAQKCVLLSIAAKLILKENRLTNYFSIILLIILAFILLHQQNLSYANSI